VSWRRVSSGMGDGAASQGSLTSSRHTSGAADQRPGRHGGSCAIPRAMVSKAKGADAKGDTSKGVKATGHRPRATAQEGDRAKGFKAKGYNKGYTS
jgi:hypothetical protein